MSAFDNPFSYNTNLEAREVRLIQASLPTNENIACSLTTASLDHGIFYDALSYVWGDASKKRRIECNGKRLNVTENLYRGLAHIARRRPDTLVWVDAICINQTNTAEKTSQVRMMTQIYAQARQVIFWLGDEENGDREAYALAELLASTTTDTSKVDSLPKDLFDPSWASLYRLLERPWFSRIWIVQEFLTARSGIFVCGRLEMQPDVIMKAAQMINAQVRLRNRISVNLDSKRQGSLQTISNAGRLAYLVETISDHGKPHLLELLFATRHYHATDRRDKIFALLAISDDFSESFIDYRKSTEELLIEIIARMLTDEIKLPSPSGYLSYAVNNIPSKNISSWVPDWTHQQHSAVPVVHLIPMLDAADECHFLIEPSKRLRVRGSIIDRIVTIIWPMPYDTPVTSETMKTPFPQLALVHGWHETASQLAFSTKTYPTGMDMDEAFWRTLVADGAGLTKLSSLEHKSAYIAWQALLGWCRFGRTKFDVTRLWNRVELALLALINMSYVAYGVLTWRSSEAVSVVQFIAWFLSWTIAHTVAKTVFRFMVGNHPDYVPNLQARIDEILQLTEKTDAFDEPFSRASAGRRFCRTEKGYLGWVSLHAQEGDPVVALLGCHVLFTVRNLNPTTSQDEANEATEREYELTGDCFIYGLMNGEALQTGSSVDEIIIV